MRWLKGGAVAVAAFVFFQVVFHGMDVNRDDALWGALAATVLAVFLWTRLAAKFRL